MSHKNAALAFDKLNSYLQDVLEWILSSMLKLNPDKTEFIIFRRHAQLKKVDAHLPARIFDNFMHPAVVVKPQCGGLMLISPLLIMSAIFAILSSFKCGISGGSDNI